MFAEPKILKADFNSKMKFSKPKIWFTELWFTELYSTPSYLGDVTRTKAEAADWLTAHQTPVE